MESSIQWLPDSLLLKVFSFLTVPELCQCIRKVCTQWNALSYDYTLWKILDLSELSETINSWEKFIEAFSKVTNCIEELHLTNCAALLKSEEVALWEAKVPIEIEDEKSDYGFDDTGSTTPVTFNNLVKISFHGTPVEVEFIQMMCIFTDKFPVLNAVAGIPEQDTTNILTVMSLRKGEKWRELHFPTTELLEEKTDDAVISFIKENNDLRVISIPKSMIDEDQLLIICKLCPELEKLNISECQWISDGLVKASSFIRGLKYLDISGTRINDHTFSALSKQCVELRHVNIAECFKITDTGITALVQNAKNLESLVLNVNRNTNPNVIGATNITNSGLEEIGIHAHHLRSLVMCYCPNISDIGLCELAKGCKDLINLDITGCLSVTDASVIAVAQNCRSLESFIAYSCTHLTSESINLLLVNCHRLNTLDLGTCHYLKGLNFDVPVHESACVVDNISDVHGTSDIEQVKGTDSVENDITSCNVLEVGNDVDSDTEHEVQDNQNIKETHGSNLDTDLHQLQGAVNDLAQIISSTSIVGTNSEVISNPLSPNLETTSEHLITNVVDNNGYTSYIHQILAESPCRLRVLDLSCCSFIANDSVKHIAKYCVLLRYINLRGCYKLTDKGILTLVKNCKLLQVLNIAGTTVLQTSRLTNESLHAIAAYCDNLVMLDIAKNPFMSLQGIQCVITRCKTLKRLRLSIRPNSITLYDAVKTVHSSRNAVYFDHLNISFESVLESRYSDLKGDYMMKFPALAQTLNTHGLAACTEVI